jgi:hypothetical protein
MLDLTVFLYLGLYALTRVATTSATPRFLPTSIASAMSS